MHITTIVELRLYEETLRFIAPSEDAPTVPGEADYIPLLPILERCRITPAVLAPGESLGQRETVTLELTDCQFDYDGTAFDSGTLWGKIRARYSSLRGYELLVYRGEVGQDLGQMERRLYYTEALSHGGGDRVTLTAKDPLKQLDGDRAKAPDASRGRTSATVTAGAGTLTLVPAGIGNAAYRAAGFATVGGREIVAYTRSGDVLTITRAQYGTDAEEHAADSSVQEVLEFNTGTSSEVDEADFNAAGLFVPAGHVWNGGLVAEIVAYLAVQYADVDPDLIPLDEWYLESDRQYAAVIAQPEDVNKLLVELIQQAGLIVWYDTLAAVIKLRSLLNVSGSVVFDEHRIMLGSYSSTDQEAKRVTEAWCYWGRINPLRPLDELANYRSIQVNIASTEYPAEFAESDPRTIRTVFGRWVDTQANAEFVTRLLLARYAAPPRLLKFDIFRADPGEPPVTGGRCRIGHHSLQNEDGGDVYIPAQVISLTPADSQWDVTAEETSTRTAGLTDRIVYLDQDTFNVNLRSLHDAQYAAPVSGDSVTFIVTDTTSVGSVVVGTAAITVGSWPAGVTLALVIDGHVRGLGGNGGSVGGPIDGTDGGTALYTRYSITVENNGTIWGGGGGGGAGAVQNGGGGGAGHGNGYGGAPDGQAGTTEQGGSGGFDGGTGGSPGSSGNAGLGGGAGNPGAGGNAIDGSSFVTLSGAGSIAGGLVN